MYIYTCIFNDCALSVIAYTSMPFDEMLKPHWNDWIAGSHIKTPNNKD